MDALRLSRLESTESSAIEDELVERARLDISAFADIYVRHRDDVFRYLRSRCAEPDDALELTAVTFERALVAIARYRTRGAGLRAWLIRIARNAAIDHERRRSHDVRRDEDAGAEPRAAPSPEDVAVALDERRRIRWLVMALPDPQRDAIAMRFGADMTAREIGAVIGKSEEATQKLISRGLTQLREAYRVDA